LNTLDVMTSEVNELNSQIRDSMARLGQIEREVAKLKELHVNESQILAANRVRFDYAKTLTGKLKDFSHELSSETCLKAADALEAKIDNIDASAYPKPQIVEPKSELAEPVSTLYNGDPDSKNAPPSVLAEGKRKKGRPVGWRKAAIQLGSQQSPSENLVDSSTTRNSSSLFSSTGLTNAHQN
jgi:hypothetical protein